MLPGIETLLDTTVDGFFVVRPGLGTTNKIDQLSDVTQSPVLVFSPSGQLAAS